MFGSKFTLPIIGLFCFTYSYISLRNIEKELIEGISVYKEVYEEEKNNERNKRRT